MSNLRSTLRTNIIALIDPANTEYTTTELDNWINEVMLEYSQIVPRKYIVTGTVTGTTITEARRILEIDYIKIGADYWQPLPKTHRGFPNGRYYDIQQSGDTAVITLGISQSAASYTLSYWAAIDKLSNDGATGIPDIHKLLIYFAAAGRSLRHQLADAITAANNSELLSQVKSAQETIIGRQYALLTIADEVEQEGIIYNGKTI